jgi:hypothetical protein
MLFRGWLHGDRHPECLAALKCSPQVKIDIGQALAADDALHPNGRCTCHGDGRCEWCKGICTTCGGDGRAPQCTDGRYSILLPKPGAEFEWHGGRCIVKLCENGRICFTDPDGRNDRWFSLDDWARNSEWIRPVGAWSEQIAKDKTATECTNRVDEKCITAAHKIGESILGIKYDSTATPEAVEASAQAPEPPEPPADFVATVNATLRAFCAWMRSHVYHSDSECATGFAPEAARMLGEVPRRNVVVDMPERPDEMGRVMEQRDEARKERDVAARDLDRHIAMYNVEVAKLMTERDTARTEAMRLRAERDIALRERDEFKVRLGKLGGTYAKDGVEWIPWRKSESDLATDIRQALTANELAKLIAELAPDGRVSQAKYDDMLAAHDNLLNSFKERGKKLMAATTELERIRISRDAILKIVQTLRESP